MILSRGTKEPLAPASANGLPRSITLSTSLVMLAGFQKQVGARIGEEVRDDRVSDCPDAL